MTILNVILFFLIPSNILLLFILKSVRWNTLKGFSAAILSYGIAPLLSALVFRYLIWIFPEREGVFYLLSILFFWVLMGLFSLSKLVLLKDYYYEITLFIRERVTTKIVLLSLPIAGFVLIFTVQALAYPIAEGDNSFYINQSQAIYEYRNISWEAESSVIIRHGQEYTYNSMIAPATPYFLALTFLVGGDSSEYFIFQFLGFYYYVLLYLVFLSLVYELAIEAKKPLSASLFFASIFFFFFWGLTRNFIFNSKESIIYFFALAGLYLVYKIINSSNRNFHFEILLGCIIGLNTLVNVHGIIIGLILLLLLFVFSKLSIKQRVYQIMSIFCYQLVFGAFQFFFNFKSIFIGLFQAFKKIIGPPLAPEQVPAPPISGVEKGTEKVIEKGIEKGSTRSEHMNLYQFNSFGDIYSKGKFQILTNIGIFGFYFWFFLLLLVGKFKELISSRLSRLILAFLGLYFFIVIDPLNINKHELAIVLAGSAKYAMLVLLVSLITLSVYADYLVKVFFNFFRRNKILIVPVLVAFILVLCFREFIIDFSLGLVRKVVPFYKEEAFYRNKIALCYYFALGSFFFYLLLYFAYFVKKYKELSFGMFIFGCLGFFVLLPFLITDVGRVPLVDTFDYIGDSKRDKLEHLLYYGGMYKVYFYAREALPRNSLILTSFSELYIHDNYFFLTRSASKLANPGYEITNKGCLQQPIYESGGFQLCKK